MGFFAFQRARRLAAEKAAAEAAAAEPEQPIDPPPPEPEPQRLSKDDRSAELMGLEWTELRDLLESYGLPSVKPKDQSWKEFAIPQILTHEGY